MHLYESIRIVVISRQTALELAMQYLIMTLSPANQMPDQLTLAWFEHGPTFTRLQSLSSALSEQYAIFGDTLRCIVFVQQRVRYNIHYHHCFGVV